MVAVASDEERAGKLCGPGCFAGRERVAGGEHTRSSASLVTKKYQSRSSMRPSCVHLLMRRVNCVADRRGRGYDLWRRPVDGSSPAEPSGALSAATVDVDDLLGVSCARTAETVHQTCHHNSDIRHNCRHGVRRAPCVVAVGGGTGPPCLPSGHTASFPTAPVHQQPPMFSHTDVVDSHQAGPSHHRRRGCVRTNKCGAVASVTAKGRPSLVATHRHPLQSLASSYPVRVVLAMGAVHRVPNVPVLDKPYGHFTSQYLSRACDATPRLRSVPVCSHAGT
jgi:hypothetical protein